MSFRNITNIPKIIDSSSNDIVNDFLVPVLKEAIQYDRGVGYFTSGWLGSVSKGVIPLVEKGGKIRLITSPYLDKKDYEAILLGDKARQDKIIYQALLRSINQLRDDLDKDTRIALSWLVADRIIDIKIAIPRNKLIGGDFHVKFGIIKDEEDSKILFMGSYNDTVHANINYEELAIFSSLDKSSELIIEQKEALFERIWGDQDPNIKTLDVPQALIKEIESFKENTKRPYNYEKFNIPLSDEKPYSVEDHKPWEYQAEAIRSWLNNHSEGILEMATGTGKTKTSLFALCELSKIHDHLIIIISCPTVSLVHQWADECLKFNLKPIICSGENNKWKGQISDEISKMNLQFRKFLTIICTHETLKNDDFKTRLDKLDKNNRNILLIADECHHLGSLGSIEKIYRDYDFTLGLSATPARFFDIEGSKFINMLLGPVVYKYELGKAIQAGFLCPYDYHIHKVYLTEDEMAEYVMISNQIKRLIGMGSTDVDNILKENSRLSGLFNQRAKILKTAEMKTEILRSILSSRKAEISHSVIFCAPDTDELDKVASLLQNLDIVSHRFTGDERQDERDKILQNFENGTYRVLTAMNIFNEGIDVPVTKEAFILSSSTNPTEFVQRRGRVLRKPKYFDKKKAIIHDFIVLPLRNDNDTLSDIDKQILYKELNRSFLFAEDALNGLTVMQELNTILDQYIKVPTIQKG